MSYEIGDELFEWPMCDKKFPKPVPEEGCRACQIGDMDAHPTTVSDYIKLEYGLTDAAARELVTKHAEILEQGMRVRSKAFYVGDQIVKADGG